MNESYIPDIANADIDIKLGTLGFLRLDNTDYYYNRKETVFNSFPATEIENNFLFNEYIQESKYYIQEKYVYPVSLLFNLLSNHLYDVEEIVRYISDFNLKLFKKRYQAFLQSKKDNRTNKRLFYTSESTKIITKDTLLSFLTNKVDQSTNSSEAEYAYHLCDSSPLSIDHYSLYVDIVEYSLNTLYSVTKFDYNHKITINFIQKLTNEISVQISNNTMWEVYRSKYPTDIKTIKDLINGYVNQKFKKNERVLPEEIFMLFPNILTPFGMDHLEEVIAELAKSINKSDDQSKFYHTLSENAKNPKLPSAAEYNVVYNNDITKMFRSNPAVARKNVEKYDFKYRNLFIPNYSEGDISAYSNDDFIFNTDANVFYMDDEIVENYKVFLRESENIIRKKYGLPNVGEGWVSETELYYKIKEKYGKKFNVTHGARPKFLGRQHLDIYIEELSVAIEYQGKQHFEPVDFFGGKKAFRENQKRDQRKQKLCIENGVEIIYVTESCKIEDIYELIDSKVSSNNII